ncbi:AGE family epimerase/isomerase [Oceaniglobus trochenteri]|uniref:AGE family epimerase/isomerase n=1 Tax=Oceaniglobus trochenteri TaxID=2763260 RepID=UPI001CFF99EC|nr:AGE family epimerase/isomerase [Oceaniglobus trochenteri]
MTTTSLWSNATGPRFIDRPAHRQWLLDQAGGLVDFFLPVSIDPEGGFHDLDRMGEPRLDSPNRELHITTRMVHCAAIAHLQGLPGADAAIDHGMRFLWSGHRDETHGGYFWTMGDGGPSNDSKQAYGHAFVLLAASSAKVVGHPDADRLLGDITQVLHDRFWDAKAGATTEEYKADWSAISDYRGQNSNMHLTEALMAAFEATQDSSYLQMANSIAELIINRHARAEGWRVAEHFHADWTVDRDYSGDPMLRPRGVTPGHALEWARLLIQLWELGGRAHDWMPEAAQSMFLTACETGWDAEKGGFYYTLGWDGRPDVPDRYWWPCCEGIAAASALLRSTGKPVFETWYRRIWSFSARHLMDPDFGGWFPELDTDLQPVERVFTGKPDIYHALQACLIPLYPADGSITLQISRPGQ